MTHMTLNVIEGLICKHIKKSGTAPPIRTLVRDTYLSNHFHWRKREKYIVSWYAENGASLKYSRTILKKTEKEKLNAWKETEKSIASLLYWSWLSIVSCYIPTFSEKMWFWKSCHSITEIIVWKNVNESNASLAFISSHTRHHAQTHKHFNQSLCPQRFNRKD